MSGSTSKSRKKTISLSACFSCGVFLGVALLHLIPDSMTDMMHSKDASRATSSPDNIGSTCLELLDMSSGQFSLPLFFVGCGFFVIAFLEHVQYQCKRSIASPPRTDASCNTDTVSIDMVIIDKSRNDDALSYVDPRTRSPTLIPAVENVRLDEELAANRKRLQALFLLLALSLHAVVEGLALGLQRTVNDLTVIFIALASHKGMEAFAVGTKHTENGISKRNYSIRMLGFTCSTPIGIILGMLLMQALSGPVAYYATSVGSAFAAGSFIEIASSSLIEEFRSTDACLYHKSLVAIVGFVCMSVLALWA